MATVQQTAATNAQSATCKHDETWGTCSSSFRHSNTNGLVQTIEILEDAVLSTSSSAWRHPRTESTGQRHGHPKHGADKHATTALRCQLLQPANWLESIGWLKVLAVLRLCLWFPTAWRPLGGQLGTGRAIDFLAILMYTPRCR